jgi:hypothetical protein
VLGDRETEGGGRWEVGRSWRS